MDVKPRKGTAFFNHGYVIVTFRGAAASATYYDFDPETGNEEILHYESFVKPISRRFIPQLGPGHVDADVSSGGAASSLSQFRGRFDGRIKRFSPIRAWSLFGAVNSSAWPEYRYVRPAQCLFSA